MHRMVANCFKAIMFSIIFVFVFDMAFYLYRALHLNQRMNSIMTSMQKVVMENNYMPEGDYAMYKEMLLQLQRDMNGDGSSSDRFIIGFSMNYGHDAASRNGNVLSSLNAKKFTLKGGAKEVDILKKDMETPAEYGDVMIVQCEVGILQPFWNWGDNKGDYEYDSRSEEERTAPNWTRIDDYRSTRFTYTYYVPCLKYQSIVTK